MYWRPSESVSRKFIQPSAAQPAPVMDLAPPPAHEPHLPRSRSSRSLRSPSAYNEQFYEADEERSDYIIDTFLKNFGNDMRENPKAWQGRFRKMAANEFAFYRGSAVLFYRDMRHDARRDPWLKECREASRIFIHVSLRLVANVWNSGGWSLGRSSRRELRHLHRRVRCDQLRRQRFRRSTVFLFLLFAV